MKKVLVMVIAMFSLCMFSACGSMQLSDEEVTKYLKKMRKSMDLKLQILHTHTTRSVKTRVMI